MLEKSKFPNQMPRNQVLFETRSPDDAIAFVEGLYGGHSLWLGSSARLDMAISGFDVGHLSVRSLRYGCNVVAEAEEERDSWLFSRILSGSTSLAAQSFVAGDAGATAPQSVRRIPMSADFELVNLRVSAVDLSEACKALLGSDLVLPLVFPEYVPGGSPAALALNSLLQRLSLVPSYNHPNAPAMEASLQEAALFELLMTWPHPYSQHFGEPTVLPRSLRLAREYIHAHVHEPLTLGAIAKEAGVGVRALTQGFRKKLGISPMRYLANCRLDEARAELRRGLRNVSVTEVALRTGFTNLGDFAAAYRRRFGQLPSETLRSGVALAVGSPQSNLL